MANASRRKFLKDGLRGILGFLVFGGCNPIDICKTLEIRQKEPDLYRIFRQITNNYDYSKLSIPEKKYLSSMHRKYGKRPINYKNLEESFGEEITKNFVYLTGHKEFTDADLIFIHRVSPDLIESIILPTTEK